MAGLLIPILPKRAYDFGTLAVGGSVNVVVAQRIDVSQYIDCMVAARVHAFGGSGSNVITLDVYGDGHTRGDPSAQFLTAAPLFTSVNLIFASPFLQTYGGTVHGQFVTVVLTATRGQAAPLNVTVSADLVLRCPDDE